MWLGRLPFADALRLQLDTREAVLAGHGRPTVFLVEHPPVVTLGRRAQASEVLWTTEGLAARGVEICETPRGGQATLHAPGQLVVYPVVEVGRRIREHVARLGAVSARLLTELGVRGAEFRMDHPGVWVGERKLASIGVHISRGVSVQGVSVNLDVDPTLFGSLVSCGLVGTQMTNATLEGGRAMGVEAAATRWAELYAQDLGRPLSWGLPDPIRAAMLS